MNPEPYSQVERAAFTRGEAHTKRKLADALTYLYANEPSSFYRKALEDVADALGLLTLPSVRFKA